MARPGKVNHIITGHYLRLNRRKVYLAGLGMIAFPSKKSMRRPSLEQMPWTPIAFREDDESKAELKARLEHWQVMAVSLTALRISIEVRLKMGAIVRH